MQKKKILITGVSGYLGRNLAKKLSEENNFNIVGLDIKSHAQIPKSVNLILKNLKDMDSQNSFFESVDLICHCAGITNQNENTKNDYEIQNVKTTEKLYKEANKYGIKKVVLTSSIAVKSMNLFNEEWPINEDNNSLPDDEYGKSKKKQEEIAINYAGNEKIQTIAIRPCAFFPTGEMDLGFRLTGSHMIVDDVVNAHISAINLLLDDKRSFKINMFEAVFTTNRLPYKNNDKNLMEFNGDMRKIIKKYWPNNYKFILNLGFKKAIFSGVYDLNKSKNILNWSPKFNFEQWIEFCVKNNFNFINERNKFQSKKSILGRLKRIIYKLRTKI